MIEVAGLTKSFGAKRVLRGVDLTVADGQFLTLVGPNGAGKTTLIRIIATLAKPTSGQVRVGGVSASEDADAVRRRIGLVSHRTLLYDDLSGEENLLFYARMYGVPQMRERVHAVLDQVELYARRRDPVRTFSRGMQQRLAIARAILHQPSLMLLDEPYTGLDPRAAAVLRGLLESLACQGQTVLMTTHDLALGLESADHVAILADGLIAFRSDAKALDDAAFRRAYQECTSGASA
jgi:heme exporter protein A